MFACSRQALWKIHSTQVIKTRITFAKLPGERALSGQISCWGCRTW